MQTTGPSTSNNAAKCCFFLEEKQGLLAIAVISILSNAVFSGLTIYYFVVWLDNQYNHPMLESWKEETRKRLVAGDILDWQYRFVEDNVNQIEAWGYVILRVEMFLFFLGFFGGFSLIPTMLPKRLLGGLGVFTVSAVNLVGLMGTAFVLALVGGSIGIGIGILVATIVTTMIETYFWLVIYRNYKKVDSQFRARVNNILAIAASTRTQQQQLQQNQQNFGMTNQPSAPP